MWLVLYIEFQGLTPFTDPVQEGVPSNRASLQKWLAAALLPAPDDDSSALQHLSSAHDPIEGVSPD